MIRLVKLKRMNLHGNCLWCASLTAIIHIIRHPYYKLNTVSRTYTTLYKYAFIYIIYERSKIQYFLKV